MENSAFCAVTRESGGKCGRGIGKSLAKSVNRCMLCRNIQEVENE